MKTASNDGYFYFDYISWESVVAVCGGDDGLYGEYLAKIGRLIERGLSHADSSVREKYVWLHHHYVDAIATIAALPSDHPYRRESFENCEIIENLPRYDELSAQARSAISSPHPITNRHNRVRGP